MMITVLKLGSDLCVCDASRADLLPVIYHQVAAFMYSINSGSGFLHSAPAAWQRHALGFCTFLILGIKNLISEGDIPRCLIIKKWKTFNVDKNLMAHS